MFVNTPSAFSSPSPPPPARSAFRCHFSQETKRAKSRRRLMVPTGLWFCTSALRLLKGYPPSFPLLLFLTRKERLFFFFTFKEIPRTSIMNQLNRFSPKCCRFSLALRLQLDQRTGSTSFQLGKTVKQRCADLDSSGALCKESGNQLFCISGN